MTKLPHSSTRRGFSTHNSVGTDNLINPNVTGGTVVGVQPGMLEMCNQAGTRYYLWADNSGNFRINATIPTNPDTDGASLGSATTSAAIPDEVITWTANEPTAGSAATVADGDTVGDDNDAGQVLADLTAKVNLILAALRADGIIAT